MHKDSFRVRLHLVSLVIQPIGSYLIWRACMEPEHACAPELISLRILLNAVLWSNLPVDEVRVENIEFVSLDNLQAEFVI